MFIRPKLYSDFFKTHEKLMRDFERDFHNTFKSFDRDHNNNDNNNYDDFFNMSLPGMNHDFHFTMPLRHWHDDDFFAPFAITHNATDNTARQQELAQVHEFDQKLEQVQNKFEQDYKKLRDNYEAELLAL